MNKLLSCRFNMDTNRVEARFEDGTTLAIDCIAVEDEYGSTPAQRQSWTGCCATGRWSTHSLCWEERWSTISRLVAIMVGWKIKLIP